MICATNPAQHRTGTGPKRDRLHNPPGAAFLRSLRPAGQQARSEQYIVQFSGDGADTGVLASLAHARFTTEKSAGIVSLATPQRSAEPMSVITSIAEARVAVDTAAASANRMLSIYTQDLEPEVYDQTPFLEIIKSFVLARSFAKVRVLLVDPTRVMTDTNRFIAMGRRLSSYIDIRYVASHMPQQRSCAYLIADERAIVYRLRADTWDGIADFNNPAVARLHLAEFDTVWNASAPERALRVARHS